MRVGSLGKVVFEVSSARVLTPASIALSCDARYEDHEVQGSSPRSEFLAPNLGSVTLAMTLRRDLGVDPVAEAQSLEAMLRRGEVVPLVLAGKYLGKWTIRSGQGHEEGVVLGAYYNEREQDPGQPPAHEYKRYADGTQMFYDREGHTCVRNMPTGEIPLTCGGSSIVITDDRIRLISPRIDLN